MNRKIFYILLIIIASLTQLSFAQGERMKSDQTMFANLENLKPFTSQLPAIVIPIIEPPPTTDTLTPLDQIPDETPSPVDARDVEIELPDFQVKGIIWNSDRPQAILNGQVVDVGSVVNDAEIKSITKEGINVSYMGHDFLIKP